MARQGAKWLFGSHREEDAAILAEWRNEFGNDQALDRLADFTVDAFGARETNRPSTDWSDGMYAAFWAAALQRRNTPVVNNGPNRCERHRWVSVKRRRHDGTAYKCWMMTGNALVSLLRAPYTATWTAEISNIEDLPRSVLEAFIRWAPQKERAHVLRTLPVVWQKHALQLLNMSPSVHAHTLIRRHEDNLPNIGDATPWRGAWVGPTARTTRIHLATLMRTLLIDWRLVMDTESALLDESVRSDEAPIMFGYYFRVLFPETELDSAVETRFRGHAEYLHRHRNTTQRLTGHAHSMRRFIENPSYVGRPRKEKAIDNDSTLKLQRSLYRYLWECVYDGSESPFQSLATPLPPRQTTERWWRAVRPVGVYSRNDPFIATLPEHGREWMSAYDGVAIVFEQPAAIVRKSCVELNQSRRVKNYVSMLVLPGSPAIVLCTREWLWATHLSVLVRSRQKHTLLHTAALRHGRWGAWCMAAAVCAHSGDWSALEWPDDSLYFMYQWVLPRAVARVPDEGAPADDVLDAMQSFVQLRQPHRLVASEAAWAREHARSLSTQKWYPAAARALDSLQPVHAGDHWVVVQNTETLCHLYLLAVTDRWGGDECWRLFRALEVDAARVQPFATAANDCAYVDGDMTSLCGVPVLPRRRDPWADNAALDDVPTRLWSWCAETPSMIQRPTDGFLLLGTAGAQPIVAPTPTIAPVPVPRNDDDALAGIFPSRSAMATLFARYAPRLVRALRAAGSPLNRSMSPVTVTMLRVKRGHTSQEDLTRQEQTMNDQRWHQYLLRRSGEIPSLDSQRFSDKMHQVARESRAVTPEDGELVS